ncbi:adenosine deaminase-like protein [Favolaschia claudopus]|uniref:Adenosine deaminase-like protein n=1 Tax=Favolaschia claudopus TaxID=2862362 RepID=A0AAW0DAY4_9AGAR
MSTANLRQPLSALRRTLSASWSSRRLTLNGRLYSQVSVAGIPAEALQSLTPSQVSFIQNLPKAELHAHLNGSIPVPVLLELAREHKSTSTSVSSHIQEGLKKLENLELKDLNDFFGLFPAIYALTATPAALARAARGVLSSFLDGDAPQSTPRATPEMTREEYVETVAAEVERYPEDKAALIVSVNRTMSEQEVEECVGIARRIVGIDICGDPIAGDMDKFAKYFADAKEDGLGVTLHIAETTENTPADTLRLLQFQPNRLGHATFLDDEAKSLVLKNKTCIELCLTSNLLCKTVSTLEQHHIQYYLAQDHPISICTDDTLPFQTSLLAEYALLLAPAPLGLGLSEDAVRRIARMSLDNRMSVLS